MSFDDVTDPDPAWPRRYEELAGRIRAVLGWKALVLEHVGSTSVPPLETTGLRLVIREPWWYGHRLLRTEEPACNLHVFGPDSPELVRHRIFRDWLRGNPADRDRYAAVKREAASAANARGEHVMQYNARKERVIREIYHRAFVADGG